MIPTDSVKRELLKEIDKLPEHQLQSVLRFVHALSSGSDRSHSPQELQEQASVQVDPLADFIGAVSHGSLAQKLDDELYGQ
jgi:hypothetical protein